MLRLMQIQWSRKTVKDRIFTILLPIPNRMIAIHRRVVVNHHPLAFSSSDTPSSIGYLPNCNLTMLLWVVWTSCRAGAKGSGLKRANSVTKAAIIWSPQMGYHYNLKDFPFLHDNILWVFNAEDIALVCVTLCHHEHLLLLRIFRKEDINLPLLSFEVFSAEVIKSLADFFTYLGVHIDPIKPLIPYYILDFFHTKYVGPTRADFYKHMQMSSNIFQIESWVSIYYSSS